MQTTTSARLPAVSKSHRCPHCGNTNRKTIQNNGLRASDPDYTLLCVALVPASKASIDPADDQIDAAGRAECGMQWDPNS